MSTYGIIYLARNKENGKVYVGQTTRTLEERRKQHERNTRNGSTFYFHNSIRKYGIDTFTWEIIDTAKSREGLDEKEKYWITYYDSFNNGYNMTEGGDGISSESRRKLWQNEEYRQKISEALKGIKRTKETKQKISEALRGIKRTKETKQKISETKKGNKNPKAKLTELQVVFIRALKPVIRTNKNRKADFKQPEIADMLQVHQTQISGILTGKRWQHIPDFEEIRSEFYRLYIEEYGELPEWAQE